MHTDIPSGQMHSTHIYQSSLHRPERRWNMSRWTNKKKILSLCGNWICQWYTSVLNDKRKKKYTQSYRQYNGLIEEKETTCFFFCIPQKVLHFLGIVHDRARGPWEQHTQTSETPQGLNKTKHIQIQYSRASILLHICYTIVLQWQRSASASVSLFGS